MGKIKFICCSLVAFVASLFLTNAVFAASGFEVTEATVSETSENVSASVYSVDGMTVRHKVIFHQLNDYADFVLTIKNTSPNIRKITDITDNNANVFVSYSYDKHIGEELNPGDSFAFVVRIMNILDDVQDPSDLTQTNSVSFDIAYDETIVPSTSADDTEDTDLAVPNTGMNTKSLGNAKKSSIGLIIATVVAGFGFTIAIIFAVKKRPRSVVVSSIIFLAMAAIVVPLSASANDNVETLNLSSTIGLRKNIHIQMKAFLDGIEIPNELVHDLPYAAILQFQQESGTIMTPALMVQELLLFDMPSQFAVERIDYSNGYDDEVVDPDAQLTDNLYVKAYIVTNLHQYSITYELNGGTVSIPNPDHYTEMSHVVINNPTKQDYYFVGWTVPGLTDEPVPYVEFDGNMLKRDLTLVANWREARIFNIDYDLDGGTLATSNPDTYKEGAPGFTLNNPTKTDWVFTGWTVEGTDDRPNKDYIVRDLDEDITLVANWKQVHLKFTKDAYFTPVSGEILEDIVLTEAIEIVAPGAYYKNEDDNSWMVRFDAWYVGYAYTHCEYLGPNINCSGQHYYPGDIIKASGTLPENDIILHAGYQLWDHAITYVLGEGGHFESEYPETYNWYSEFDFPAPVREGYIFTGWKIEHLVTPSLAHYHAHWTPQLIGINRGPITMIALWEEGGDLATIEYLQDIKYGNCANTPVDTAVTLKDKRDGKSYRVKRLEDGRCWLADNLALEGVTLTSDDSDIAEGTTFNLPASNLSSVSSYYASPGHVAAYADETRGGYYTYAAATASSGTNLGSYDGQTAPYSICPKGWKLPSGPKNKGGKEEYSDLFEIYNTQELFTGNGIGPNLPFNGYLDHNEFHNEGMAGYYWTATTDYRDEAYALYVYKPGYSVNFEVRHNSHERLYGSAVRCYMWD